MDDYDDFKKVEEIKGLEEQSEDEIVRKIMRNHISEREFEKLIF